MTGLTLFSSPPPRGNNYPFPFPPLMKRIIFPHFLPLEEKIASSHILPFGDGLISIISSP